MNPVLREGLPSLSPGVFLGHGCPTLWGLGRTSEGGSVWLSVSAEANFPSGFTHMTINSGPPVATRPSLFLVIDAVGLRSCSKTTWLSGVPVRPRAPCGKAGWTIGHSSWSGVSRSGSTLMNPPQVPCLVARLLLPRSRIGPSASVGHTSGTGRCSRRTRASTCPFINGLCPVLARPFFSPNWKAPPPRATRRRRSHTSPCLGPCRSRPWGSCEHTMTASRRIKRVSYRAHPS